MPYDYRKSERLRTNSEFVATMKGKRLSTDGLSLFYRQNGAGNFRVGISVGGRLARLSCRWADWRSQVLAGLASRRWDALMAQHRLIDARLLDDVAERDGRLYAWTVNERGAIGALRGLGVHGITTADPRLFAPV